VLEPEPFARLRLEGGRFDEEGMPVETLAELAAYEDLVVGVAKELFRSAHPERRRVPRGFEDRFQLRLKAVEEGSAMPVLERVAPIGALSAFDDDFTQARNAIEDAIAAVGRGDALPDNFPERALVLFNRFGQTLRQEESIELRRASATEGPKYTTQIRRRLVLSSRNTYQDEVRDIGRVVAIDSGRMSCTLRLRTEAQGQIVAPLDVVTFSPAKEVLEPNGEGPQVRVSGVGEFDTHNQLIRFDSIHEISVIDDPEELMALDLRLGEIASLSTGWLDGDGRATDPRVMKRAQTGPSGSSSELRSAAAQIVPYF